MDIRNFFGSKGGGPPKKPDQNKTSQKRPSEDATSPKGKSPGASKAGGSPPSKRQKSEEGPAGNATEARPSSVSKFFGPGSGQANQTPTGKEKRLPAETLDLTGEDDFSEPPTSKVHSSKRARKVSPEKAAPTSPLTAEKSPAKRTSKADANASTASSVKAPPSKKQTLTKDEPGARPQSKPESELKFSLLDGEAVKPIGGGFKDVHKDAVPPNKGKKPTPRGPDGCLAGLTFVISGVLDSLERPEMEAFLKRHGGRVTSSVSGKTDYLVVGMDCGQTKYNKAKACGTALVDEDCLFEFLEGLTPVAAPAEAPRPSAPAPATSSASASSAAASAQPPKATPRPVIAQPAAAAKAPPVAPPRKPLAPGADLLWVDKHKPQTPADLIGNSDKVKQLQWFLNTWHQNFDHPAGGDKKKVAAKDAPKKCALISGPPGIGKTSAVILIIRHLGFTPCEVNASDTRGKSDKDIEGGVAGKLTNQIKEMVTNRAMSFGAKPTNGSRGMVLVMDEVDGIAGNAERGGVADIIESIRISKIPIVCMCNDAYNPKVKSLQNHCLDLRFNRPPKNSIAKRMCEIARKEGLEVDEVTMSELVETCNNDIRWVLNSLQMRRKASSKLSYDDVAGNKQGSKDKDLSPFTVCDELLGPDALRTSFGERINLMFQDADIMPLFIQENYLQMNPASAGRDESKRIDTLSMAADALSDGDIVNLRVRKYQKWGLMPAANAMFVRCASLMSGRRETFDLFPGERNFHRFPGWLGKNSSAGKQKRLLGELHSRMSAAPHFEADRLALRLQYLPMLRQALTAPLRTGGSDGIPVVMEIMDDYCLTREDFDTVQELCKFKGKSPVLADPMAGVPTAVKSAFTRECNKPTRTARTASQVQAGLTKGKAKKKAATEEDGEGGDDGEAEDGPEKEEEEDDGLDDKQKKLAKISSRKLSRINFEEKVDPKAKGKGGKGKAAAGKSASASKAKGKGKK